MFSILDFNFVISKSTKNYRINENSLYVYIRHGLFHTLLNFMLNFMQIVLINYYSLLIQFQKIRFTFLFFKKPVYYLFINRDQLNQVHQNQFIVMKIFNLCKANSDIQLLHSIHYFIVKLDLMSHLCYFLRFPMIIFIFVVLRLQLK